MVAIAATLVVGAAVAALQLAAERREEPSLIDAGAITPRDRLLIADFVDTGGDTALAIAITDAFRVDLAQSPKVRVMTPRQVRGAHARAAIHHAEFEPGIGRPQVLVRGVPRGHAARLGAAVDLHHAGAQALLGVGQGSRRESHVAVMQWNGAARSKQPIAFIGKGVTFDTGGISIKPAAGMGDMKWDMGGAGAVAGLMMALAGRKAKANVVGIIGLVENMPDGNAQRPGDIVTSMSGKTIEILNTDAEGRLVLADVLWYCQKRFKPSFMVDLATLTGAIIVALGQEYAGMFGNDDRLCERLTKAGQATMERVWRMPLGPEYDKLIESKFADMKNTGGRHGGSITAAQLLARFVDKTPWVHLDIAGTALGSPQTDINKSWSSGWGVRLLNQLVEDHYER